MSNPFTQTQVAEKSILDVFGRQTYLGQSYYLPHTGALTSGSESVVLYLPCPAQSTPWTAKALFIKTLIAASSTTDVIVMRVYRTPTGVTKNTATAPAAARSGILTPSVTSAYMDATVSTKGAPIAPFIANGHQAIDLLVVDPGTDLLITAQAAANTPTVFLTLGWYEI